MKKTEQAYMMFALDHFGEKLADALNECTSIIDKFDHLMDDFNAESEADNEKIQIMFAKILAMKAMATAFAESIQTSDEADKAVRKSIEHFFGEEDE